MEKEKISIIVPVYNVENYLDRCIESIIHQTYKNLEIILVDDGSTDRSLEICFKYKEVDNRIKVVHQNNGGMSSARNAGIKISTGNYYGFVDSDDYISCEMYEILYTNLMKFKADICGCRYKIVLKDEELTPCAIYNIEEYEGKSKFLNLYNQNKENTVVIWNKLYKKDIFSNIAFKEGMCHEDEYIIHHLLDVGKKVIVVNKELYYYVRHEKSIMNKRFSMARLDIIKALDNRMEFMEVNGDCDLKLQAAVDYLKRVQFYWYQTKKFFPEEKEVCKSIILRYRSIFHEYKRQMNWVQRMRFRLFIIFPKINHIIKDMLK